MITKFKSSESSTRRLELIYYLLGKCNYSCDYCYWNDFRYKEESFNKQRQILDTIFQINTPANLFIFGGEPTLCTYIVDLIEYISVNKPDNFQTELQTHGEVHPDTLKKILNNNLHVSVSIHHNQIKNKKRLIDNLKLIDSCGKLERIDFMFEDAEYNKQKILFNLLKALGYLDKILPTYGYMNLPKFNFQYSNSKKLKGIFKSCIDQCTSREMYKVDYMDNASKIKDASELYEEVLNFKGWECQAGNELMLIDNKGLYWQCTSSHFYDDSGTTDNLLINKDKFLDRTTRSCICKYNKCNWDLYVNRHKHD